MSCESCASSLKAKDETLVNLRVRAKELAVDLQRPVAIIIDDEGQYALMEAGLAVTNNYRIKEIISHYA